MSKFTPNFEALKKKDRHALFLYGVIAALAICGGVAFIVYGLGPESPGDNMLRIGGFALTGLSTLPLKQVLSRYDRLGDIALVESEWLQVSSMETPPERHLERLEAALDRLYTPSTVVF